DPAPDASRAGQERDHHEQRAVSERGGGMVAHGRLSVRPGAPCGVQYMPEAASASERGVKKSLVAIVDFKSDLDSGIRPYAQRSRTPASLDAHSQWCLAGAPPLRARRRLRDDGMCDRGTESGAAAGRQ